MNYYKHFFTFLFVFTHNAWAAEVMSSTPSNGMFKMVSGLAIVLIIMAAVTWLIKRVLPNMANNQKSIARVISSVSVGSRERVVVVEVADRWIVVGVAPGQVNGIANLDASIQQGLESTSQFTINAVPQGISTDFSQWLQKSAAKFVNKKSSKDDNEK